ncbi:YceI family protein [Stenoxybacter acetivorans]|uniref:YceI family protein n=1 Tax=Stenoxybacter acetivorans TaxID=422441 RepID=UPI00055C743D|nr:YceI family protein [Stenoxybacter acetivorans]
MKQIIITACTFAALVAPAWAAEYQIDPAHTNARFAVDHFNTSTNIGGFFNLTGKVEYDAAKQSGFADITIPVNTLNSGRPAFDQHLKAADFFDANRFPNMRFVSDMWVFADGKLKEIQGNLTLLGKTHPVTLTTTKFNCYQSPMLKTEVCGGDFETAINGAQWGMNYLLKAAATAPIKLSIQIEAAKK